MFKKICPRPYDFESEKYIAECFSNYFDRVLPNNGQVIHFYMNGRMHRGAYSIITNSLIHDNSCIEIKDLEFKTWSPITPLNFRDNLSCGYDCIAEEFMRGEEIRELTNDEIIILIPEICRLTPIILPVSCALSPEYFIKKLIDEKYKNANLNAKDC